MIRETFFNKYDYLRLILALTVAGLCAVTRIGIGYAQPTDAPPVAKQAENAGSQLREHHVQAASLKNRKPLDAPQSLEQRVTQLEETVEELRARLDRIETPAVFPLGQNSRSENK